MSFLTNKYLIKYLMHQQTIERKFIFVMQKYGNSQSLHTSLPCEWYFCILVLLVTECFGQ